MRLLRSYFFWTYERGSLHYDVMVTMILLFLFVAPRYINFHDQAVEALPSNPHEVMAGPDGSGGTVYRVRIQDVRQTGEGLEHDLGAAVEPVAGTSRIARSETIHDNHGAVAGYKVWVVR